LPGEGKNVLFHRGASDNLQIHKVAFSFFWNDDIRVSLIYTMMSFFIIAFFLISGNFYALLFKVASVVTKI
jgi:hypothetical protein